MAMREDDGIMRGERRRREGGEDERSIVAECDCDDDASSRGDVMDHSRCGWDGCRDSKAEFDPKSNVRAERQAV